MQKVAEAASSTMLRYCFVKIFPPNIIDLIFIVKFRKSVKLQHYIITVKSSRLRSSKKAHREIVKYVYGSISLVLTQNCANMSVWLSRACSDTI